MIKSVKKWSAKLNRASVPVKWTRKPTQRHRTRLASSTHRSTTQPTKYFRLAHRRASTTFPMTSKWHRQSNPVLRYNSPINWLIKFSSNQNQCTINSQTSLPNNSNITNSCNLLTHFNSSYITNNCSKCTNSSCYNNNSNNNNNSNSKIDSMRVWPWRTSSLTRVQCRPIQRQEELSNRWCYR